MFIALYSAIVRFVYCSLFSTSTFCLLLFIQHYYILFIAPSVHSLQTLLNLHETESPVKNLHVLVLVRDLIYIALVLQRLMATPWDGLVFAAIWA